MRVLFLAGLASIMVPFAAGAADWIESEQYVQTQASSGYGEVQVCNDLVLKYRPPHNPHIDVVRVCHPPMPGE